MVQLGRINETSVMEERRKRILIVDDFQPLRDMLKAWFTHLGYEVIVAENGLEALEFFSNTHVDFVITDLSMPIMDGPSLVRWIRQRIPGIPLVMMTAEERSQEIEEMERGFVDAVLFKPFTLPDIKKIVDDLFK